MRIKVTISMLLLSAVWTTPTLANYFYNPHANIAFNISSAPSPTPRDIRHNRLPKIVHAAPPYASAMADNTTKNTRGRTEGMAVIRSRLCGA